MPRKKDPAAVELGRKGGKKTAQRGSEYFRPCFASVGTPREAEHVNFGSSPLWVAAIFAINVVPIAFVNSLLGLDMTPGLPWAVIGMHKTAALGQA